MKTIKSFVFSTVCTLVAGLIWTSTAVAAETTSGEAAASIPAGAAGIVVAFRGEVKAIDASGASRALKKNDPVRVGDLLSTGPGAYVVIEFVDGAKATLRPNSELNIDRYEYGTGEDGSVVNLIKGGLRAITGQIAKQQPESFKVETSVATLGVRGTEFSFYVCGQDC